MGLTLSLCSRSFPPAVGLRIPSVFERNIPLVLVWMKDGSGQFILAYPSSVHPRCLTKSTATHGDVLA